MANLALDRSISRTQRLLKLLSDEDRPRQQIFDFLNEDHSAGLPLWVQDENGWTVLHFAAHREDDQMVARFLELGANWNLCTLSFKTPQSNHRARTSHPCPPSNSPTYLHTNLHSWLPLSCSGLAGNHGRRDRTLPEQSTMLSTHSTGRDTFRFGFSPFASLLELRIMKV